MKRIFVFIGVIIFTLLLQSTTTAEDQSVAACKQVLNSFINCLRMGGTNESAKKYCTLPLKDFWGNQIPYDGFVNAMRKRIGAGWQPMAYADMGIGGVVRCDFGDLKLCLEEEKKRRMDSAYRVNLWFGRDQSGNWKLAGIKLYEPNNEYFNYGSCP